MLPKDPVVREKWMHFIFCGRLSHGSVSLSECSVHLKDDCFENKSQNDAGFARKLLLKDKSVPTILDSTTTTQTGPPSEPSAMLLWSRCQHNMAPPHRVSHTVTAPIITQSPGPVPSFMSSAHSLDQPASHPPPISSSVALPAPEPMQVDTYHLSNAERQRRLTQHLCLYCGEKVISSTTARFDHHTQRESAHRLRVCRELNLSSTSTKTQPPEETRLTRISHSHLGKPLGRGRVRHFSPTVTLCRLPA